MSRLVDVPRDALTLILARYIEGDTRDDVASLAAMRQLIAALEET